MVTVIGYRSKNLISAENWGKICIAFDLSKGKYLYLHSTNCLCLVLKRVISFYKFLRTTVKPACSYIKNLIKEIMCGISLFIDKSSRANVEAITKNMNRLVKHRGPDDVDSFISGKLGLGHCRLSIIDLSEKARQPMEKNDAWISFNGEIYNYRELRTELELMGHEFYSASDTEVILSAWRAWGVKAFEKFNGMWAFVLFDEKEQKVIACRDNFGIKPLVYTTNDNYFAAGSEIKQFLGLPGFVPRLNHKVTYDFLMQGLVNHSSDTFFEEVQTLKAGHYLVYDLAKHSYKINKWYHLQKKIKQNSQDFNAAREKVSLLLQKSIDIRMRSDVKVGSCLSGGIDSSGIVTTIHKNQLGQNDFSTLTSCYSDKQCNESVFSDAIENQCGFDSFKTYPELNDLFNKGDLDKMLYHHEQPISTASNYSEFKIFELAAEKELKVLMDGQGADEYFWGYDEYFDAYIRELLKKGGVIRAAKLILDKSSHHEGGLYQTISMLIKNSLYYPLVKKLKKFTGREEPGWINKKWQRSCRLNTVSNAEVSGCDELSMKQMCITSLPAQLHSADRNSMCFSIEARTPFLDPDLVEFVMGMPGNYKINEGYSKYILRQALPDLPETVRWRKHKLGFPAPDQAWIKNNPVQIRKELKSAIKETCFFNDELLTRYDKYITGQLAYESIYIRAISLHRFIKLFGIQFYPDNLPVETKVNIIKPQPIEDFSYSY